MTHHPTWKHFLCEWEGLFTAIHEKMERRGKQSQGKKIVQLFFPLFYPNNGTFEKGLINLFMVHFRVLLAGRMHHENCACCEVTTKVSEARPLLVHLRWCHTRTAMTPEYVGEFSTCIIHQPVNIMEMQNSYQNAPIL